MKLTYEELENKIREMNEEIYELNEKLKALKPKAKRTTSPRAVVCEITGKLYDSITDAAAHKGYSYAYITSMLSGRYKNNSGLLYLEDYIEKYGKG